MVVAITESRGFSLNTPAEPAIMDIPPGPTTPSSIVAPPIPPLIALDIPAIRLPAGTKTKFTSFANAINGGPRVWATATPNTFNSFIVAVNSDIASLPMISWNDFAVSPATAFAFSELDTSLASWETSTPMESARAFLCMAFNLLNSSSEPTCFTTSFIAPSMSLLRANSRAFCKFNCLPMRTDASTSFVILSWKFNNPSDIFAVSCNDKPKALAWTAALTRLSPPSLENEANSSAEPAKSFITASGATLFATANWKAPSVSCSACSADKPDVVCKIPLSLAASSFDRPTAFAVSMTWADRSAASVALIPNSPAKALVVATTSSMVAPIPTTSISASISESLNSSLWTFREPNCFPMASTEAANFWAIASKPANIAADTAVAFPNLSAKDTDSCPASTSSCFLSVKTSKISKYLKPSPPAFLTASVIASLSFNSPLCIWAAISSNLFCCPWDKFNRAISSWASLWARANSRCLLSCLVANESPNALATFPFAKDCNLDEKLLSSCFSVLSSSFSIDRICFPTFTWSSIESLMSCCSSDLCFSSSMILSWACLYDRLVLLWAFKMSCCFFISAVKSLAFFLLSSAIISLS